MGHFKLYAVGPLVSMPVGLATQFRVLCLWNALCRKGCRDRLRGVGDGRACICGLHKFVPVTWHAALQGDPVYRAFDLLVPNNLKSIGSLGLCHFVTEWF
jgi:hypothetical protein